MTTKLEAKLTEVFTVLNRTKRLIEKFFYAQNARSFQSAVFECIKTKNVLTDYEIFHIRDALNSSYSEENFSIDLGRSY